MPKEIVIDFGSITQDNVEQLRLLNRTCFPIAYTDGFYKDVVKRKDDNLCKFAFHNGFVVGAICARLEAIPKEEALQFESDTTTVTSTKSNKGGPKRIYIMTLGVLAAYRGRGIGQKLVQSVMDYYESYTKMQQEDESKTEKKSGANAGDQHELDGVKQVVLHVQNNNEDAIDFYVNKFGFEKGELIENYYSKIDPPHAFILRKVL